jgi:hypothetical protein
LTDQQVTTAIYLITAGRSPTDPEIKDAQKMLAEGSVRRANILRLARSLVQGKEFNATFAGVQERLAKARADLASEGDFAKAAARLNSSEFQKLTEEVATTMSNAAKLDEDFVDLAFLLTFSHFPQEQHRKQALEHLKKASNRATATPDVIWALLNTKEFLFGK